MSRRLAFAVALGVLPLATSAETPPTKAWDKTYDSGSGDVLHGVAVDPAGNTVLVVNPTSTTAGEGNMRRIEYGGDGTLKHDAWLSLIGDFGGYPPSVTVDQFGRVFGFMTFDGTRVSCQGRKDGGLWIDLSGRDGSIATRFRHQPSGEWDYPYQVRSDMLGNVFALCFAYQEISSTPCTVVYPYLVTKFAIDGSEQWTRSVTAYGSMVPDGAGGVFVVGSSSTCWGCPSSCPGDISIFKLAPNGSPASFGVGGTKTDNWGGDEWAYSARLDAGGRLFVSGVSRTIKASTCSTTATRTRKAAYYDATTGSRTGLIDLGDDSPYGDFYVLPDGQGGAGVVRVSHTTTGGSTGDTAYQVARYTPAGAAVWTVNVAVADSGTVSVYGMAADATGSVYVLVNAWACTAAGTPSEACTGAYRLIKYAGADGSIAWSLPSDGTAMTYAQGVFLDDGLTLRVVALSRPSGICLDCDTRDDLRVIRYIQQGSIQATPAPEDPNNAEPQLTAASPKGGLNPDKAEEIVVRVHPTTADITQVTAKVYSSNGRLVRSNPPILPSGSTVLIGWNGKDDDGAPAAAGLYLMRVNAPGVSKIVKIVVVR